MLNLQPTESIIRIIGDYQTPYSVTISNAIRVENVKQTGSVFYGHQEKILTKTVGNYQNSYEVFQSTGRFYNNLGIRDLPLSSTLNPIIVLTSTAIYTMPSRNKNKNVFVVKFSAPGDKNSLRNGGTDLFGLEFSPYNVTNWRNLSSKKQLNTDYQTVFSDSQTSTYTEHKINPNKRYITMNGVSYTTKSDNGFVQHQIPFHMDQVSWISSSLKKAYNPWQTASLVWQYSQFNLQTGSEYYYTETLTALDSAGSNSRVTSPFSGSELTYSFSSDYATIYGFNPWIQIRSSQNWKSRLLKNNSYIVIDKDEDSDNIFTITSSR